MKQCSEAMIRYLENTDNFVTNDLYSIRLTNGAEYNFVDGDTDITAGNKQYRHDGPVIIRDQTKITGTPSVDTLSVSVCAPFGDSKNTGGMNILNMAHLGLLDDSSIELQRAYFDPESNTLVGTVKLFKGRAQVQSAGGTTIKLEVKSETTGLSQLFPIRIYAPVKAYIVNKDGIIVSSSEDEATCAVPLKPSQNILSRGIF